MYSGSSRAVPDWNKFIPILIFNLVQVVAANEGTFSCLYDVPGDKELEETIYAYIRSKWSI